MPRLKHSARGLGMLKARRIGQGKRFDVWSDAGELEIRNVTAEEISTTYCTSLTEEQVIDGVAQHHHLDADGFRVTAHMAISG
jgi:hypothetical protein